MLNTNKNNELKIYQPMKYWWLYFVISLAVIIPGTYSLINRGLKLGIDFTGGTKIAWQSPTVTTDIIRDLANNHKIDVKEVNITNENIFVTTTTIDRNQYQLLLNDAKKIGEVRELSFDTIGPSLGAELVKKTLYGILLAASLILLYVAYRFQNFRFGLSAILAMLHDSLIILGIFSLMQIEIDTLFVTALLTILSFSVHDTIVVFDRVRELKKKHGNLDFEEVVNRAVVETMSRSVNNSMTIIFMLLAMYLLGGDTTKWFIFALLIGTVSGTYSSTFTAAPILVLWEKLSVKAKKKKFDKKQKRQD